MKLFIFGLVIIKYVGEIETLFRGKAHNRKYPKVNKGEMVIVDEVTAIQYCRGTQWERVESNVDISDFLKDTSKTEELREVLSNEPLPFEKDETENSALNDEAKELKEESEEPLREATLENINDLHLNEVKHACKKFGIKYGRKKIEDLVPLLLPFLQQEND